MDRAVDLSAKLEQVAHEFVESGHYASRDEVLRDAARLIEERERRLAELDAAIERGIADADAGRVYTTEEVKENLLAPIPSLGNVIGNAGECDACNTGH